MDPIGDVPLGQLGQWAKKNLVGNRVVDSLAANWSRYKTTYKGSPMPILHVVGVLVIAGFLTNYKHQVPNREHH